MNKNFFLAILLALPLCSFATSSSYNTVTLINNCEKVVHWKVHGKKERAGDSLKRGETEQFILNHSGHQYKLTISPWAWTDSMNSNYKKNKYVRVCTFNATQDLKITLSNPSTDKKHLCTFDSSSLTKIGCKQA